MLKTLMLLASNSHHTAIRVEKRAKTARAENAENKQLAISSHRMAARLLSFRETITIYSKGDYYLFKGRLLSIQRAKTTLYPYQ